jgi:peptidoglycan/LPS O-acetylase OafA/YrhL
VIPQETQVVALRPELARSRARASRLDALRVGAAGLVVFIHASAGPATLSAESATPLSRALAGSAFRLASSLAVPTFLLLAFLQLAPALGARTDLRRVAQRCLRIVPVYLFWTALYAAMKLASGEARATPSVVAQYVLLGSSAAHLYFLPLLLVLTALAPAWIWLARRPALGAAAAIALPVGASYLAGAAGTGVWAHSLLGMAGNAAYAIAGATLALRGRGGEPAPERRRLVFAISFGAALAAGAIVAAHGAAEGLAAAALPATLASRVARVAFPIATLCAVLSSQVRLPGWTATLAPLTFGIYLVHPLVLVPIRMLEARVGHLASHDVLLALPNALLGFAAAGLAVLVLFDTRLRRVLA